MTDSTNTEATSEDLGPVPGKSKAPVIFAIIGVVGLASGLSAFLASQSGHATATKDPLQRGEEVGPVVELEPFISNLVGSDDDMHYLKCRLVLELMNEKAGPEVTKRLPLIRQEVLLALSGLKIADALGAQNKLKLHQLLTDRIVKVVGKGTVRRVFLTEFVIQ